MGYKYYMFLGFIFCIIGFIFDWSKIMYGLYFLGIGDILYEIQKIKEKK